MIPFLDADTVTERLPWPVVIAALEAAVGPAFGDAAFVDRTSVPTAAGELLLMPATSPEQVGDKLVGVGHDNAEHGLPRIHGVYVLFDARTLVPLALLDGTSLTTIRTAGQSAMIVQRLASPDAHRIVVFGSGPQARAHVQALRSIRPIDSVGVVGRRPAAVETLCRELDDGVLRLHPATPDEVADADIVVCATTAVTPVFDGRRLGDQVCVVAVGSHTPDVRELDDHTLARARVVVVEHLDTARRTAGEIVAGLSSGALDPGRLRDFGQLADPLVTAAPGVADYKSVGLAYQDLALAAAAVRGPDEGSSACS